MKSYNRHLLPHDQADHLLGVKFDTRAKRALKDILESGGFANQSEAVYEALFTLARRMGLRYNNTPYPTLLSTSSAPAEKERLVTELSRITNLVS